MEQLTIKELAPYLPYKLRLRIEHGTQFEDITMYGLNFEGDVMTVWSKSTGYKEFGSRVIKPYLRPLSQLTEELEHNGERFVPIEYFEIGDDDSGYSYDFGNGNVNLIKDLKTTAEHDLHHDLLFQPFAVTQKLIEWHFDVFGLIKKGLAIPIPSLNS